jgi:capsule polysaccharide export protein KpsE/RkpR
MRDLLEQGAQVSKELVSKAGEKAQDWGEKGLRASKELVSKAGAKAQDLGERGVLSLEIRQLETQAQKLIGQLGTEVYNAFVERGAKSVTVDTPAVKAILGELASIRDAIEKREAELQSRKQTDDAGSP